MPLCYLRSILDVLWNQSFAVTALGSGERRWQKWLPTQTCHHFGLWQKDLHPNQTEVSSATTYRKKEADGPSRMEEADGPSRRKEADGPSFSPVLPCSSFPPTYTSPGSWRTEGLKVSVFHLAIPARSGSEVPAVTLQWSINTLKRQLTALIQLSSKQHTDTRTRNNFIYFRGKKNNHSILT